MAYEMEVRTLQSQPVASIRVTTTPAEIGSTLGQLLPEIWRHLEKLGVHPAGPPFARYHAHDAGQVDLEAGLPVPGPIAGDERIAAGELPAGEVVTTWHVGPYDTLSRAYEAVEAWIKERGREPAGAPWEVYWTDPGEVPDPNEWKTELLWPVH